MDLLFDAGASDVWVTPIIMKKSRPATTLSVLCQPSKAMEMKTILFEQATTIGLREYPVQKSVLRREEKTVTTKLGDVRIKESYFNGKRVRVKPEFEDCKKLALQYGKSIEDINNEILKSL